MYIYIHVHSMCKLAQKTWYIYVQCQHKTKRLIPLLLPVYIIRYCMCTAHMYNTCGVVTPTNKQTNKGNNMHQRTLA